MEQSLSLRGSEGPDLNGGGTAAESGEAQPVRGRCFSDAFQKQQQKLKKEVEAEATTVGSSGGGRDENAKEKIRTGAQK